MNIRVDSSQIHNVGVFACVDFQIGEKIEICPVILAPKKDRHLIDQTILYNYYFDWRGKEAIALGYGSLYNHSYSPNAKYIKDFCNNCIEFVAIKPIKKDQEILVNYNGLPYSKKKVWFDSK